MYIAAQIVGVVAVAMFLSSYQFKTRKNIILVNASANILYVLQYIMLGAFEGAFVDSLSAMSSIVANNKHKSLIAKNTKAVVVFINLLFLLAGVVTYKNIFSLCAIIGSALQTNALWITDEKKIRLVSFLGSPFWLVYNFISHSYGPTVGSVLNMLSIGLAIYRYDICPKIKREVK